MKVKLKKHGNSHAIVIPKAILELFNIEKDAEFDLEMKGNKLILSKPQVEMLNIADKLIKKHKSVLERLS